MQSAVKSAHAAGVVVVAVNAQGRWPAGFVRRLEELRHVNHLAKTIGDKAISPSLTRHRRGTDLERVRGCKEAVAKHPDIKCQHQNGKQGVTRP